MSGPFNAVPLRPMTLDEWTDAYLRERKYVGHSESVEMTALAHQAFRLLHGRWPTRIEIEDAGPPQ